MSSSYPVGTAGGEWRITRLDEHNLDEEKRHPSRRLQATVPARAVLIVLRFINPDKNCPFPWMPKWGKFDK